MATHTAEQQTPTQKSVLAVMDDLQKLFAELVLSEQRHDLIRELDAAILRSTFSPQEVFNLIIEKCLSKTGSQHGQVILYQHDQLIVAASSERQRVGETLPLDGSLSGLAIRTLEDQHWPNVADLSPGSYVRYHDDTQSELVVLIRPTATSRVVGVLDLERDRQGEFSANAISFAQLLAGQAAIAIEHARTWSVVQILYRISTALVSGTLTLENSFKTILADLLDVFDFAHGQLLRLVGDELIIVASSRPADVGLRLDKDSSICWRYLVAEKHRDILVIDDLGASAYSDVYLPLLGDESVVMRSEMVVPLLDDRGVLVGALNIESPQLARFSTFDLNVFGVVGRLMATAIAATVASTERATEDRIKAAGLAMTHLGHVAQSFLHRFGSAVGDARGRLVETGLHLSGTELPAIRGKKVVDFLGDIVGNLDAARLILDDFSEKFNPQSSAFQFKHMDLAAVGRNVLEQFRAKHAELPIAFNLANRALPAVDGKRQVSASGRLICNLTEKIYEVLGNLLDNAVWAVLQKAGPGFVGEVQVILERTDSLWARLEVHDNGVGIASDLKAKVFEFGFSTRKSSGASQGIGLWFCEYYTRQLGGRIKFTSVVGEGSSFSVEFPTVSERC